MKRSPDSVRLEAVLRASTLVAGGFMGTDMRSPEDVIEADAATLGRVGHTAADVGARMQEVSDLAIAGLGSDVDVGGGLVASATDTRGQVACPWPHRGRFPKTVIVVTHVSTEEQMQWSLLSVHLVKRHGFFQGTDAAFRQNPTQLVRLLFA